MQVALIAAARCGRHLRIVVFHAGAAGQSKDAGQGDCAFDNRIHTRLSPLHRIAMTIAPSRALSPQPMPMAAGGRAGPRRFPIEHSARSEEHTSELQSLMSTSYAVFCLKT